ncbi:hypothetical protein AC629_42810, partial [Bradyrhizobium sp. NAS80.1]|uniref:LysR substrate-binding domain-containing protein n=1 Tax=Bradyrhizobium sp. NAS80.1 TaxID=1680159 RepID=UPI000964E910
GEKLARAFEDANVPLRLAAEVSQSSIACALVHAGVGIAVLDGFALMAARDQGMEIRPFAPRIPIQARLLQARHRPLSNLARAFIDVLYSMVGPSRPIAPTA